MAKKKTLEDIKKCKLTTFDGQQAVELSGKLTDGTPYVDIYPITEDRANELRKIGVQ